MQHIAIAARMALDRTLAQLQGLPPSDSSAALAVGIALPDASSACTRWRMPPLEAGAADPAPDLAQRLRAQMARQPHAALALMHRGASGASPPASLDAWQAWLTRLAPAYRLLSPTRDPAVLALWLGESGQAAGALRTERAWQPLSELSLPGPDMLRVPLGGASPRPAQPGETDDLAAGRYSRPAGALGHEVLRRWQHSVFAVVGAGRTGSLVAHTLVRAGASVLLLDPDRVEAHNLCGDVLPQHEGLPKPDAVARWLRPLLRPGAFIDARSMDIGDRACGLLLQGCDVVVSCVDDDRARLWVTAWCTALQLPHLDIGVAVRLDGEIGADLRLVVPGEGCLGCVGGFARPDRLPTHAAADVRESVRDFRLQRAGSLRTWAQMATHAGLRLLELMYAGTVRHSVFRRLQEDRWGRLSATESDAHSRADCPLCTGAAAMGSAAVHRGAVTQWARAWAA